MTNKQPKLMCLFSLHAYSYEENHFLNKFAMLGVITVSDQTSQFYLIMQLKLYTLYNHIELKPGKQYKT